MFKVPENKRILDGPMGSDESYENNGQFIISYNGLKYLCQASDGFAWEHVSISIMKKTMVPIKRCPTWEEMYMIKDIFWDKNDTVLQYHPSEENYVNQYPYVLHLWRPKNEKIPIPPVFLVGTKSTDKQ